MAVHKEYEGKNVESAIEAASRSLGVSADKLNYEVIEYGNSGLFGFIGVKKAKIKVKVSSGDRSEENVNSLVDEAFSSGETKKKKKSYFSKPDKEKKKKNEFKKEVIEEKQNKKSEYEEKKQDLKIEEESVVEDDVFDSYEEENESLAVEISEEAVEKGREALEKILPLLAESFEISPEIKANEVIYNLKAENPGVVIGKKGQNLEAIQFLIDKIVNKVSEGRIRVLIDIEDYLERRKQNLQSIALRYADKVKKSGKPATIGQLSAYERRFIHIALRDDRRVRTQSMGEGYYRKLVVFPSRRPKGKRRVTKNN
ncbi:MAG: RNA-binding cell elongation regulator Jag/EloR [Desulforegulaceae bacterium]|nr:RNA-binding cell elongation regulator Jag/EloR [Desulforegulaceae bacterium]